MPAILINGRYVLSGNPKVGGMADLYRAYDTEMNLPVAIKLFREGTFDQAILAESFKRETQALRELKHPGIVEMMDAGVDTETGRRFIVLEWVEHDLSEWLESSTLAGWDQYYQEFGKYILEALAFAHNRHFIHRDLKTKNVLISEDYRPKLADFGIAKLKEFTEPGLTLADFASRPFTPPEYDDGTQTYSRDVYSFGVLTLNCLTDVPLKEYKDVTKALQEFDAPPEVAELIARAVTSEPSKRPWHAGILLTELEKIWQARSSNWNRPDCYLRLSQLALQTLKAELRKDSEQEIQRAVIQDLENVCGVKPVEFKNDGNPPTPDVRFSLFGERFHYAVAIDNRTRDHLFVKKVFSPSPSLLDKLRESSFRPSYRFRFGKPPDTAVGVSLLEDLQLSVDEYLAQMRNQLQVKADEHFFHIWETILRAKTQIEKGRNVPVRYRAFSIEGNRITFNLAEYPDDDIIGQSRVIRSQSGDVISGEIETIAGKDLTFYVLYGDIARLPRSGRLEFDTRAADAALERQKNAVDAVRFDRAVRPGLKELIAHPEHARLPTELGAIDFATSNLDGAKQRAVSAALGTKDVLIVEGPPGTGKTTFIAEVVVQTLRRNPNTRILLTSQTHVALDNAIERIKVLSPKTSIVRVVGKAGSARVAPECQELLLLNQMVRWREEVLASGRQFVVNWAADNQISPDDVTFGMRLKEFVSTRRELLVKKNELKNLNAELRRLTGDDSAAVSLITAGLGGEEDQILDLTNDISRTRTEIKSTSSMLEQIQKQLIMLNDLAKDLIEQPDDDLDDWVAEYLPDSPATKGLLTLLSIFSEWETQFGRREEFEVALMASAQLIAGTCLGVTGIKGAQEISYDLCIVDEASKATPTEVLIPISRAHRWILVGDQRQLSPFQDPDLMKNETLTRYELRKDDLKTTLFDHLIDRLPESCKTGLTIQHRMVPPIGSLISECFYDGRLKSASKTLDTHLNLVFPKPVTWFTTAGSQNRSEQTIDSSYVNYGEIRFLHQLLGRINWRAALDGLKYTVAVITAYSGQQKAIMRSIANEVNNWTQLSIECNTVDAFQGREADIALYSVTRSNEEGRIGFLHEKERINVALSRGRFYLGIIGDHLFCREAQGINPFRTVLTHIEADPEGCKIEEISI